MVKSAPSASSSASATGPILPAGVESKVEQYLKKICPAPAPAARRARSSDMATASAPGCVRDFSAITTASASGIGPAGMPIVCTVLMPAAASIIGQVGRAGEVVRDTA